MGKTKGGVAIEWLKRPRWAEMFVAIEVGVLEKRFVRECEFGYSRRDPRVRWEYAKWWEGGEGQGVQGVF